MTMQAVKSCSVCGADLHGQKRIKDAAGRYFCDPCYQAKVPAGNLPFAEEQRASRPIQSGDVVPAIETDGKRTNIGSNPMTAAVEPVGDQMVTCPACAELVKSAAIKCRFCGEKLKKKKEPKDDGSKAKPPRRSSGMLLLLSVVAGTISVIVGIAYYQMAETKSDVRQVNDKISERMETENAKLGAMFDVPGTYEVRGTLGGQSNRRVTVRANDRADAAAKARALGLEPVSSKGVRGEVIWDAKRTGD